MSREIFLFGRGSRLCYFMFRIAVRNMFFIHRSVSGEQGFDSVALLDVCFFSCW